MKKTAKKCELIVKVLIGLALLSGTSCSSLFDDFMNDDGSLKSGDTSLSSSSFSSRGGNSSSSSGQNPSNENVINSNPEAFYSSDDERKNTEISSGIVVLKATEENCNQIIYDSAQHEYEVGYDKSAVCTDAQKAARNHSSAVFLCAKDDPVTVKAFKNNSNAKITYSAVQTRTTNIANGNFSTESIRENMEVFVDLPEASQMPVEFSVAGGNGDPIVFSNLPYGTTCVKITIIADDDYYSDSYIVYLNKKHILTSLSEAEEGNSEKTDLTTGLVVLKESDGFNKNQISYEPSVKDYKTANLTSKDNTVYLKAVPSDKNATVSWSASYTAKPVYKYEYYQTVTKTVVKVDANGKLIEGPKTTKETKKVASGSENSNNIEEVTASDGSITTTTTSTVTRKSIVGLDKMEEVTPEDISSILLPVENQNSDRVRVTSLPYGVTKVTAKICSYDKTNPLEELYTITLPRVQYYSTSQGLPNSVSGNSGAAGCEDDTSKLEDLSVTNLETIDDDGNETNVETQAVTNFTFNKEETIYSLVVDEDTDVMIINPTLSENESMSYPVSKTKYSELKSNDYSVNLLGGLQVITFTVTEEGCQPRTYTIYAYKQSGNTILEAINYSSYDCVSGRWTAQSMAAANYESGLTAMTPAAVKLINGAVKSENANTYKLNVRADNACDVSKMKFSVKAYDSHTHIYYYAGDTCPAENDSKWGRGYLAADSSNEKLIELSNEGVTAVTKLWLKTVSRPYYHSDDFNGKTSASVSPRSDVTYHKIEISKPGKKNVTFKELLIRGVSETDKEDTLYSDPDTEDGAGVTHKAGNRIQNVTTDTDIVKIYFRLADKSDENDLKKIRYSVENTRKSSTETEANTEFTMSPAKDTEFTDSSYEIIDGKKYYVITLGEIAVETGDVLAGRTSKDLPMGETKITIYINDELSGTITLNKPDLDCHELTAKPLIGNGSNGVYATSFYDTVYYLNKDTESVILTMNTKQKNEKITVEAYKKTADQNGGTASESFSVSDSTYISISQSNEKPYTQWTSEVSKIPVGTSEVVYNVTSADVRAGNNESAFTTCKVTFVRAEDKETRLQAYSVTGPDDKAISGFSWSDAGATAGVNTYVNNFTLTAGTGKYTVTARPMNNNESVSVSVYGTVTEVNELTDAVYSIDGWKTIQTSSTTAASYTFNLASNYRYVLVRALVENGNYKHYYDTLITLDLETTAGIKVTGKQYYNKNVSDGGDVLDFTEFAKPAVTNVNSKGDIHIDVEKSEKASWRDGYPKVTVDSEDITDDVTIESNKSIVIPFDIYSKYLGKTITLTYSASAELSSLVESKDYKIKVSDFVKVTDYDKWGKTYKYTWGRPAENHNKQLAFRFASMINEVNTNWIYKATENKSKTGGVDIVGSLDGGTNWGATSYNFSGLHYLVQQGSSLYLAKLEESSGNTTKAEKFYLLDVSKKTAKEKSETDLGISLSVNAEVCYDGETPYIVLTASVEGADKLGVIMDTLVAPEANATKRDADSVTIETTNNGFFMAGDRYKFSVFLKNALGVDDVTRFWYGAYTSENGLGYLDSVFTNKQSGFSQNQNKDSAISFSWDLTSTGQTSKSFRVTIE